MLGKIGSAFITGVHGLALVFGFVAVAAFMAWAMGGILEGVTRRVLGWHVSESTWIVLCLTIFLVVYGLALVAPALVETVWIGVKGAFCGALASGAVAWFFRLPWQTVAAWGGIAFFVLCVFAGLRQRRPAPFIPFPDPYNIRADDPDKRMKEEGYTR